MAKQSRSRVGRAKGAAKAITPLALSFKQWWDGLTDKEKARYREQAGRIVRQAQQAGKAGLDRAKAARGGGKDRKKS
jgi:hypothetical protein